MRRVKEGTSAEQLQSSLNENWWADSMECCTYLRYVTDLLGDGKTPYERRFGEPIEEQGHSFFCDETAENKGRRDGSKQPTPHGKWPKPPRAQKVARPQLLGLPSVPRATWQPPLLRHRPKGISIYGAKQL